MPLRGKVISSSENRDYRLLLDCLEAKGIRKQNKFLVFGERVVAEILSASSHLPAMIEGLVVDESRHVSASGELQPPLLQGIQSQLSLEKLNLLVLKHSLFENLDLFGTRAPILVVRSPPLPKANLMEPPLGIELLCALGDPHNLGTVLRSAAAFGVHRVILLKECASPFLPKAVRAASGTTLTTALSLGPSIRTLNNPVNESPLNTQEPSLPSGVCAGPLYALDMQGTYLSELRWPQNVRLLLGEEGRGLPPLKGSQPITIPMKENVESLNAPVAASIAFYSYRLSYPLSAPLSAPLGAK